MLTYCAMVPSTRGSGFEPIDEPIRAELFSVERLEQHARSLAETQELSGRRGRLRLISRRLAENGEVLLSSYRELSKAIREEALLTPAAEWLVDNFHLVESQLREIRENLPPSYYHELPKIKGGHLAGYPRVYGIAWAYVAHLDSRFDPEALRRFVAAYQEVEPLTIGELWAIPITLRLILIENLRRMAESIVRARRLRREADEIADGLLGSRSRPPERGRAGPRPVRPRPSCPSLLPSSCFCGFATTIRRPPPVSPGCSITWPPKGRHPTRWSTKPIVARRPPTSPSATSSPASVTSIPSTGPTSSRGSAWSTRLWRRRAPTAT